MNTLKFRIAAKTDVGLVRQNNEDNFQASSDLSTYPMRWVNNEICSLGNKGALLVVADGMGGMNAGEVASEIAIETVKEYFSPENITDEVVKSRFSIEKFMNSSIEEADARIKKEAKNNPESKGMGTTIVIGWIFDNKLYVSWCGDSRAYVYNPNAGLHQISKDHSYVQSLVDKGAITKEDAFDYPESNIITRCLCDSSTKAKPESLLSPYELCNGDIVMLCTDGLSGMIHDNEIEAIIRNNEHDMDSCTDNLIQAACDAEGSDNITICVAQIMQGAKKSDPSVFEAYDKRISGPSKKANVTSTIVPSPPTPKKKYRIGIIALLALIAVVVGATWSWKHYYADSTSSNTEKPDSTEVKSNIATISISDRNGNMFTVERKEGTPQVGDIASPDGKFYMDDNTILKIVNGKIESISLEEKANSTKVEPVQTKDLKKSPTNKSNNDKPSTKSTGVLNGKIGESAIGGNTNDEDVLTPVSNNNDPNDSNVSFTEHKIQEGETLFSIAKHYHVTEGSILSLNQGINPKALKIGSTIRIPKN